MKIFITALALLGTVSAFAGTCQVVARSESGAGAFRTGVEKSKNLSRCLETASVIGEGWHNAMLKYVDSKGKETVLKLERRSSEEFKNYYSSGDSVNN